ncbi:SPFH domain-containing protein [Novisyntrophococcus fermenticellae]|uniref:SPFH domain-containing protein n=1 Tax=Novisyntrophococcus fermenticellae TaxID=2068655 RepID=UPI001E29C3DE|nr:SPFH domain-containing protein [Novisyntrophococcus fermenticellae]
MGLIRMAAGAVSGTLRDQTLEVFECGQMGDGVLMQPAVRVMRGGKNKGTENVISSGSTFNVARNQCAILVENGRVHDLVIGDENTEGQYRYDSTVEPSLLVGGFMELKPVMHQVWERFTAGGQSKNIMRLCYINLQEIRDNKIGLGNVPFRDSEFQITVKVQGFGRYSFQIKNPVAFFENVCNDPSRKVEREELTAQMKSEVLASMQPALGRIAAKGISYDMLINYPVQIAEELNKELDAKWEQLRGIVMVNLALESVTVDDASAEKISKLQEARAMGTNTAIAGGRLVNAQANAMESAASNSAGAMTGFMGFGMAGGNDAGANAMELMRQANQQQTSQSQKQEKEDGKISWDCVCGKTGNIGKFCPECGAPKPEIKNWFCTECGAKNSGRFCSECGARRP